MKQQGRDLVAIILAVGIATSLNFITIGVLWDAIFSEGPGLSSNATQILTASFGGIIGVLGSYIGFKAGRALNGSNGSNGPTTPPSPPPSDPE